MMPQGPAPSAAPEAWLTWLRAWHVFFLTVLVCVTGLVLANPDRAVDAAIIALTTGLLLWYGISVRLGPPFWQARQPALVAYLIVGWTLWFLLARQDATFMLALALLFPQLFIYAEMRIAAALSTLLVLLSVVVLAETSGGLSPTWLAVGAAMMGGTLVTAGFIDGIIRQSDERRRLIEQLAATQDELAATQHRAGVLAERERLAGEIHDTLAQGFTAIIMQLEAARTADDPSKHLAQAGQTARDSLAEARRFVWALRPPALEDTHFEAGLRGTVERWSSAQGIPADLTVTGSPAAHLPPAVELAALRVLGEALANVARHAAAQHVTVTLSYMRDTLVLDVQDDGRGFDPQAPYSPAPDGGFGLDGMRTRVADLGGTLTIESGPGVGTTIAAAFPLDHLPEPPP